ncbi:Cof-type HAD-IIB family hydrolase [Thermicanus aegyptius]|uniref:Cof-type HAD-IIB family hydrolase n=1 Tax=Thermicanus aegyptius TaxID=94009 RepID=UPI0003FFEDC4|nr:HAD family hydrolase [Thermicanus aegyptius]
MYRLIATDMDGTLLHTDGKPSQDTLEAFHWLKGKGVKIVVATGRVISAILPLLHPFVPDRILTSNGAVIYAGEGEPLWFQGISPRTALRLINHLEEGGSRVSYYEVFGHDGTIYTERKLEKATLAKRRILKKGEMKGWIEDGRITPVKFFIAVKPEDREAFHSSLEDRVRGEPVHLTFSGNDNVEVVAEGVSKSSALERVCREWGISMEEVIAFGDSGNDVEMIERVGLGVAMGNGVEKVKKVSRLITSTNDEDGILPVLHRYFRLDR